MKNDMRMAKICMTALEELAYPSLQADGDAHGSVPLAEGPSKEEPEAYIKLVTDQGPSNKCSSGLRHRTARPAYLRMVADDRTS